MARLAASGSTSFFPKVEMLAKLVTGRRLAAVTTVFGLLPLQLSHFLLKSIEPLNKHFNQSNNSVFALSIHGANLITRHLDRHW
jgi:hypothetical protein